MIKVLHLITWLNPGGIERWILDMLEAIPRADCEMDVCCQGSTRGRWANRAQSLGAKVMLNTFTPEHILFGTRLARILRFGAYDILHVHVGVYSGFPVWIGHRMNVKVVTTFHSIAFPAHVSFLKLPLLGSLRSLYARLSIKYAVLESDFIVGVSQAVVDAFVPNKNKFRAKSCIIHHGIKIGEIEAEQTRDSFLGKLGWPEDSALIIHVGRFDAWKNHHGVLNVFKRVAEKITKVRLILVGDGELRPEIERMAHELSLSDKIAFLGFRDDVPEILAHCDLMVMVSLFEGFGIAAIEAAAAGLPVVGSSVAGLVETVENGRTGFLFEPTDYEGMADAILRLLSDTDFAKLIGEAGRQRVREHFSMEKMADQYVGLYKRCLNQ